MFRRRKVGPQNRSGVNRLGMSDWIVSFLRHDRIMPARASGVKQKVTRSGDGVRSGLGRWHTLEE